MNVIPFENRHRQMRTQKKPNKIYPKVDDPKYLHMKKFQAKVLCGNSVPFWPPPSRVVFLGDVQALV
jgi:hypothetical protein